MRHFRLKAEELKLTMANKIATNNVAISVTVTITIIRSYSSP